MAGALATVVDLVDMWRPLADAELERAQNLLMKASALLRQATRQTLDDRIELFETNPADPRAVDPLIAATVVATIVKRFIANVDGAITVSDTAGPYAHSVSYARRGDKDIRGEMVVTEQDIANLSPELPPQVGSFTVGVSPTVLRGMQATTHRAGDVYPLSGRAW